MPKETATSTVFASIRKDVLLHRRKGGSNISLSGISRDLNVGISVVRQAVNQLSTIGIATDLKRGHSVATVEAKDLLATAPGRIYLESLSAKTLADKIERKEVRKLELKGLKQCQSYITKICKAAKTGRISDLDEMTFIDSDLKFHTSIAELADMGDVVPHIQRSYYSLCIARNTRLHYQDIIAIRDDHSKVLDAISAGRGTLACRYLREHLVNTVSRCITSISGQEEVEEILVVLRDILAAFPTRR